jgi:hypothetical protein
MGGDRGGGTARAQRRCRTRRDVPYERQLSVNQIALTEWGGMAWENGAAIHLSTADCSHNKLARQTLTRQSIE